MKVVFGHNISMYLVDDHGFHVDYKVRLVIVRLDTMFLIVIALVDSQVLVVIAA